MILCFSIDPEIIENLNTKAAGKQKNLVLLDSNHTHDHVLSELEADAPLTFLASYFIVFDTVGENFSNDTFDDHSCGVDDNPKTAV